MVRRSRLPGFYRSSVSERHHRLRDAGFLLPGDFSTLQSAGQVLTLEAADRMVENVVGVFGLPLGVALNFRINHRDVVVPLVVEEPSVIAALSSAAKLAAGAGGFTTRGAPPLLIGQLQLTHVADALRTRDLLLERKEEVLSLANSLHPRMVARGGGARDLEVTCYERPDRSASMLAVHLLVDTGDAMGANLVNSMCEGVASLVEKISGGKVLLRIVSNLTDRALVEAEVTLPISLLGEGSTPGDQVRDGIILANDFARIDPHRAATHNKGIMNGVDAVALATGNDWRAIEASCHAYAARGSHYSALTRWESDPQGNLKGTLELPLKVGIVGGSLQANPAAALALRILNVHSSQELAEVMAAVGLAQNLAALRALVTDGIQQGHMTLHARSVASSAGASGPFFDAVVEQLVASGEIKVWKAKEIFDSLVGSESSRAIPEMSEGFGRIVLLGDLAESFGRYAIAGPLPLSIRARVVEADSGITLVIVRWGVEEKLSAHPAHQHALQESLWTVLKHLGLQNAALRIEVYPEVPRAMGLGASAALAVAVVRALSHHYGLGLSDAEVSTLAFECDTVAHGRPSGLDNTVATYGKLTLFRQGPPSETRVLCPPHPIPLVIGMSGKESLTSRVTARVQERYGADRDHFEAIFESMNALSVSGSEAIEAYDLVRLGRLMNQNRTCLNQIGGSSPEGEALVRLAMEQGALGATPTGGGASVVALCPAHPEKVAGAIRAAGYSSLVTTVG